jgi:hypothetical protein
MHLMTVSWPLLSLLRAWHSVSWLGTSALIQGHVLLWRLASYRECVNNPSSTVGIVVFKHALSTWNS